MNRIKKALEKCRTYVAVQKFGCGHTGIGHGVEDSLLQFLDEAFEELARLEKREPTLMSDCISAGLPLDVALKYDVQLCRLTNYVRDKTLADCVKQEPVACVLITYGREPECVTYDDIEELPEGEHNLYTAPPTAAQAARQMKDTIVDIIKTSNTLSEAFNAIAALPIIGEGK